jgi:ABC-type bacteriocin/lantibiotic exporter with double-glycine peptidase domain
VVARLRKMVRFLLADAEEEQGFVHVAPAVPVREVFWRFSPHAKPYRRWLPLILLLAALGPAVQAVTIWMYKVLIDEVLVPRNFDILGWVMLAYVGLTLAEGFVSFCDEYLSEWVGGRFIVSLRTDFFRHLQGLSLGFFDRQSLGEMISTRSRD